MKITRNTVCCLVLFSLLLLGQIDTLARAQEDDLDEHFENLSEEEDSEELKLILKNSNNIEDCVHSIYFKMMTIEQR